MDPAGEVGVRGEDGSIEAPEDEGGEGRRRGRSRRVREESEAPDLIRGGCRGEPLELRPSIRVGGEWGG